MHRLLLLVLTLLASAAAVQADGAAGGKIVYPRKEGDGYKLHVMNADGTGDRLLPGQAAAFNFFPTWSPDGKRIAYMAAPALGEEQFHIALNSAEGGAEKTLNTNSQRSGLAAWSRDGKQLAFASGDEGGPGVYVCDPEGNGIRQVSPAGGRAFGPVWMPDGKTLGYTRFMEGGKAKFALAKVDGSAEETLFEAEGIALAGPNALSPDGKRMLYVAFSPEQQEKGTLNMWDFEAKSQSTVLEFEAAGKEVVFMALPAWAPDGKSFLIAMKTDQGSGLFKVSEDGKTRARLTPAGVDCLSGAWVGSD